MRLICVAGLLLVGVATAYSQPHVSVVGGGGLASGEDQKTSGVVAVGASAGFPYAGRHGFQIDYLFTNIGGSLRAPEIGLNIPDADNRNQFLTGSYVLQARRGRSRPFFQIGAGVVHRSFHTASPVPGGSYRHVVEKDTSLGLLFGAGATIDVGQSLFVRPQVRMYMYVGPTVVVLPSAGFGWRF